ncbi:MAG: DUF4349 domain-containing protein [Candidatus Woesearchaeota archaeon]
MTFKEQLEKLKENWLTISLVVIVVFTMFVFMTGSGLRTISQSYGSATDSYNPSYLSKGSTGYYPENNYLNSNSNLAPNILNRMIIKTTSMNVEVKDYYGSEAMLKNSASTHDAIITSENVNANNKYHSGYYTLRVPVDQYDGLVAKLKTLGTVKSFNENANDVTGSYVNLKDVLIMEKSKLSSYEELYDSTANLNDKIQLLDRITSQKSLISSLQYQLADEKERVVYATLQVSLSEKSPAYASIVFATFADLWAAFLSSLNIFLYIVAYVLPFVFVGLIILGVRKFMKRESKGKKK